MKKILAFALSVTLIASLGGCGTTETSSTAIDSSSMETTTGSYTEGVYEASQKGMNGDVKVGVTFTGDSISEVKILEHKETEGLADPALEQIPASIVAHQSLAIDTISGATMTSNAILLAVSNCVEQAGGDVESLKNKEVQEVVNTETVIKEADVIVVGGGSAGLSAAVALAEGGQSVLLIETNEYLGGNTVRTGGGIIITDPSNMPTDPMTQAQFDEVQRVIDTEVTDPIAKGWQDVVAQDIVSYQSGEKTGMYDSIEYTSLQYFFNNSQKPDPDQLYNMFAESLPLKNWLGDMGFQWSTEPTVLVGHNWPRMYFSTEYKGGNGFINVFTDHIDSKKLPVEMITGLHANELIVEDGKVTGVKATSTKGQPHELKATNGVVLATGGFGSNPEMLLKYSDGQFDNVDKIPSTNDPSIQGDGIVMAEKVDAQLFDMGAMQVLPIADPENGNTKSFAGTTTGLYINKEGVRFVDETENRDNMVAAISNQTDSEYYVISAEKNNGIDENGYNMMGVSLENLLDSGKVIKADTVVELAEKININPTTLQTTIDSFNVAVDTKIDTAFDRITYHPDFIDAGQTLEITEGPFYACLRSPAVHITKGGILIDAQGRVLDNNDVPIPGLYAAGEVTGGIYVKGLGHSLFTGRIAGETALAASIS